MKPCRQSLASPTLRPTGMVANVQPFRHFRRLRPAQNILNSSLGAVGPIVGSILDPVLDNVLSQLDNLAQVGGGAAVAIQMPSGGHGCPTASPPTPTTTKGSKAAVRCPPAAVIPGDGQFTHYCFQGQVSIAGSLICTYASNSVNGPQGCTGPPATSPTGPSSRTIRRRRHRQ
jgi:hypothetical protein